MPICSACGKEVSMGYRIIRNKILCSTCAEKFDEIVDDLLAKCLEEYFTKHTLPNLDEELKKYEKIINELKFSKSFIKVYILSRFASLISRRS